MIPEENIIEFEELAAGKQGGIFTEARNILDDYVWNGYATVYQKETFFKVLDLLRCEENEDLKNMKK